MCPTNVTPYDDEIAIVVPTTNTTPSLTDGNSSNEVMDVREETTQERELGSPKTATESSGKYFFIQTLFYHPFIGHYYFSASYDGYSSSTSL